jgi:hypothetical protein
MSEILHTMTGLEACFEEELSKLPGWQSEFMQFEQSRNVEQPVETEQDKAVEENMLLGV